MTTLFENNDFILKSTGHNYDFVGIIETKGCKPLTFFFSEEYIPHNLEEEENWDFYDFEDNIDEEETVFLEVWKGLKTHDPENGDPYGDDDEEQDMAEQLRATNLDTDCISFFRTRDDGTTGFLACPRDRGQFLALVKAFCPERMKDINWA